VKDRVEVVLMRAEAEEAVTALRHVAKEVFDGEGDKAEALYRAADRLAKATGQRSWGYA
jgi:hypothetical protein